MGSVCSSSNEKVKNMISAQYQVRSSKGHDYNVIKTSKLYNLFSSSLNRHSLA